MKQPRDLDTAVVVAAVHEAAAILGAYVEPGPRDAAKSMSRLLEVRHK